MFKLQVLTMDHGTNDYEWRTVKTFDNKTEALKAFAGMGDDYRLIDSAGTEYAHTSGIMIPMDSIVPPYTPREVTEEEKRVFSQLGNPPAPTPEFWNH